MYLPPPKAECRFYANIMIFYCNIGTPYVKIAGKSLQLYYRLFFVGEALEPPVPGCKILPG
jgi:hypothetical protein